MGPTLSLNSLPNSKYLHSSYVFSLLFHKENRSESSRSIPNGSILTLLSLDLSSEVNSSIFLCFRSYPGTLILCFFQDLPCLSHFPQILGYKCTWAFPSLKKNVTVTQEPSSNWWCSQPNCAINTPHFPFWNLKVIYKHSFWSQTMLCLNNFSIILTFLNSPFIFYFNFLYFDIIFSFPTTVSKDSFLSPIPHHFPPDI